MQRDYKTYLAWLNNAYGQEMAMAKMYGMHAKDAKKGLNQFPQLVDRLEKQVKICHKQAELIAGCLQRHGATPNPAKIALGNTMGALLGFTGDVTIDKVIMNDLTDVGMAQFEVGAYLTLVAAAEAMDDPETANICRQILEEERELVAWLEKETPTVAVEFLKRTRQNNQKK
jgi:ferritin-like metal-binding protein YciE